MINITALQIINPKKIAIHPKKERRRDLTVLLVFTVPTANFMQPINEVKLVFSGNVHQINLTCSDQR